MKEGEGRKVGGDLATVLTSRLWQKCSLSNRKNQFYRSRMGWQTLHSTENVVAISKDGHTCTFLNYAKKRKKKRNF